MLTPETHSLDQVANYLIGLAKDHPWNPKNDPMHPRHRRTINLGGTVVTIQFVLVCYGVRRFYSLKLVPKPKTTALKDDLCNYIKGYFFKDTPAEDVLEIPSHPRPDTRTFISELAECDHDCNNCPYKSSCKEAVHN